MERHPAHRTAHRPFAVRHLQDSRGSRHPGEQASPRYDIRSSGKPCPGMILAYSWGDTVTVFSFNKVVRSRDKHMALGLNVLHIGFSFLEETYAYWMTLDLLLSVGTSLKEAAQALVALKGGTQGSERWLMRQSHRSPGFTL